MVSIFGAKDFKGMPLLSVLGLLGTWTTQVQTQIAAPCSSNVYCGGDLLRRVQLAKIYPDSKSFVDMRMVQTENETLRNFNDLLNKTDFDPSQLDLKMFVNTHFVEGEELVVWSPPDFKSNPPLLSKIRDPKFKEFAREIISIWPTLGRAIHPRVYEKPNLYSLIAIPNPFIVPGGRFKETYYWDSYWIIKGLILSGMTETARGMIENFFYLVRTIGHVPNGNRIYYKDRSQPPMLTAMVSLYIEATKDLDWLLRNIDVIEDELQYWLEKRSVGVVKDNKKYILLRYMTNSFNPRPESYAEDFEMAETLFKEKRQNFFMNIKSAAESGWDFSSRWFVDQRGTNSGNLTNINTDRIIPVDLNSIFAGACETLGNLYSMIKKRRSAQKWWTLAKYWRTSIDEVFWHEADGVWYDFDLDLRTSRRYFFPICISPLWMNCVDEEKMEKYVPKVLNYLDSSVGMKYSGGIPASMTNTGEQWDFPNAWAPMQSLLVHGLSNMKHNLGKVKARDLAELWVRANYKGFTENKEMYEKYDAEIPGRNGGGGEYFVQAGFGWTNGVVLEFLDLFGDEISSEDQI